jgi:hypothetical protein
MFGKAGVLIEGVGVSSPWTPQAPGDDEMPEVIPGVFIDGKPVALAAISL